MSPNIIHEVYFLLQAVILGMFITFVYDGFRILRRVIVHNNFFISIEDFIFWLVCGAITFSLLYYENNGTLRWFAILGSAVGMVLYKLTLSRIFVKSTVFILNKMITVIGRIVCLVIKPFGYAGRSVGKGCKSVKQKIKKFLRFLKKKLTAWLKVVKMILCKQ